MDWQTKFNEPFFLNKKDAETYVSQELRAAVPEGWAFRAMEEPLAWMIYQEPHTFPQQNYGVKVSKGLDLAILTYGNSDAGAFNVSLVLQRAFVIEAVMLRAFSLRQCIARLMEERANTWGLT